MPSAPHEQSSLVTEGTLSGPAPEFQYGRYGNFTCASSGTLWQPESHLVRQERTASLTAHQLHAASLASEIPRNDISENEFPQRGLIWRDMRRAFPQISSALPTVQELVREELRTDALDGGPFPRHLLDSVYLVHPLRKSEALSVIAFVVGSAHDQLAFHLCKSGTAQHTEADVHSTEACTWEPRNGPIQQVAFTTFPENDGIEAVLLVRFDNAFAILKPSLRPAGDALPGFNPPLSFSFGFDTRSYPLQFYELGTGVVDLCLDPENPARLAAIHKQGQISLWIVSRTSPGAQASATTLRYDLPAVEGAAQMRWYRAFWLPGGVLLVCNLEKLHILCPDRGFAVVSSISLHDEESHSRKDTCSIVHVEQDTFSPCNIVAISARCIHWLTAHQSIDTHSSAADDWVLREQSRWQHYIDVEGNEVCLTLRGNDLYSYPENTLILTIDV